MSERHSTYSEIPAGVALGVYCPDCRLPFDSDVGTICSCDDLSRFDRQKKETLERLTREQDSLDPEVPTGLMILNGVEGVYTLQSCQGHHLPEYGQVTRHPGVWLRLDEERFDLMAICGWLARTAFFDDVRVLFGRERFPVVEVLYTFHQSFTDACTLLARSLERAR